MNKSGTSLPIIGLTGAMCSGKNVAASILEDLGYSVIDADKMAHQALEALEAEVLSEFDKEAREAGITLTHPDGTLNRRALGALLFSRVELLARHEAIIYPKINELLLAAIEACEQTAEKGGIVKGIILNAPLLHKTPLLNRCAFVIFIDALPFIRFFRALRRDSLSPRQILSRFSSQKNLFTQYILKNVDIVRVRNQGSRRALEKKLVLTLSLRGL